MDYKDQRFIYKVHKKTSWTKEELDEIGADSRMFLAGEIITKGIIVLMYGFFAAMLAFVVIVSIVSNALISMLPIIFIMALLLLGYIYIVNSTKDANYTVYLADDKIYFQRDRRFIQGIGSIKINYNNIHCVYEAPKCPRELILGLKDKKSLYSEEFLSIWTAFNGNYIVAENKEGRVLCGLRYNEEAWNRLKEKCPEDTIFQTYEEHKTYKEEQRRIMQKADEKIKNYDGYIN